MKLQISLVKGMTEEQVKTLESEIKHSLLARTLRSWLREEIAKAEIREEELDFAVTTQLAKQVGERRGYRRVLNYLPEE